MFKFDPTKKITPFSKVCECHGIRFDDGLHMFYPHNKYVKTCITNDNLIVLNNDNNLRFDDNVNELIPHQIMCSKLEMDVISDRFSYLDKNYVAELYHRRISFIEDKRLRLSCYVGDKIDFIGFLTRITYNNYEQIQNLLFVNVARKSDPANILTDHVWYATSAKNTDRKYILGKPYGFTGIIYEYARRNCKNVINDTNKDFGIKHESVKKCAGERYVYGENSRSSYKA